MNGLEANLIEAVGTNSTRQLSYQQPQTIFSYSVVCKNIPTNDRVHVWRGPALTSTNGWQRIQSFPLDDSITNLNNIVTLDGTTRTVVVNLADTNSMERAFYGATTSTNMFDITKSGKK